MCLILDLPPSAPVTNTVPKLLWKTLYRREVEYRAVLFKKRINLFAHTFAYNFNEDFHKYK